MKTAISVPDDTFAKATQRAAQLGMSRSEFFSRAAVRYLAELDAESVTTRINDALTAAGLDDSTTNAVTRGHRVLAESDEW